MTTKSWHSEFDYEFRDEIQETIKCMFYMKCENNGWKTITKDRFYEIINDIEEALYTKAQSFEEYSDKTTLKKRIANIFNKIINRKIKKIKT
jgi:hypothetical protein